MPLTSRVALLLVGSGFCALVYQVAWLRMLRMIFGASTAASAAVLGIFMAGLGVGGLVLGRRADRTRKPLRMYAHLEAGVAIAAILTPLLILVVRALYVGVGGTMALGEGLGTVVRLLLAAVVLGLPTFLAGGTLPAAVRAVETQEDVGRRHTGFLYAANTTGAVLGALFATFFALEMFGVQATIWVAGLINLLVALIARSMSRSLDDVEADPAPRPDAVTTPRLRYRFVLLAAAGAGFAFLLMELVWYRMLSPLLGGSSYTFGLILAVALAGIGLGSYLYAAFPRNRRPTLVTFAATCTLEALFIAIPFAMGDDLAILAARLQPVGDLGFMPLVGVWTAITCLVVLPASIVAGYQFPLLLALLGRGRAAVGRELGLTYAFNTAGAILGSLAGGFGLIPLLGAVGVWQAVVWVLLAFGAAALILAALSKELGARALVPLATGGLAVLMLGALGPTAVWRHTPIGAGRFQPEFDGPNAYRNVLNQVRRGMVWERDGVESALGIKQTNGIAHILSGKSDGHAYLDAPTFIWTGLVPAILHPEPKRALVIGMGTGSTAGWLAQVDSIERVDVVELEPAVLEIAAMCGPVNRQVMQHPKVHTIIGDGREVLLTTDTDYDIIISQPSNPYRAGVSSLFTVDFYEAVAERLRPGGRFAQWVQLYDINAATIRVIYTSLGRVFPAVETWALRQGADLMLMASKEAAPHDVAQLRARAAEAPYADALRRVWGVEGLEGVYTGFLAGPALAQLLAAIEPDVVNTDDLTVIEFEFARRVGLGSANLHHEIEGLARRMNAHRPIPTPPIDWARVDELKSVRTLAEGVDAWQPRLEADGAARVRARQAWLKDDLPGSQRHWASQPHQAPVGAMDAVMRAEILALVGDPAAPALIDRVRPWQTPAARALTAAWHFAQKDADAATAALVTAFEAYRTDPWSPPALMQRALTLAGRIARAHPGHTGRLFDALEKQFAVGMLEDRRLRTLLILASIEPSLCVKAFAGYEPHVPWDANLLRDRARCYAQADHPLAGRAAADLATFQANEPDTFRQLGR